MGKLVTDGELLKRFTRAGRGGPGGDEASFQKLLNRHARMVFQVCFRVLGNTADAEDAAQAVYSKLASVPVQARKPAD